MAIYLTHFISRGTKFGLKTPGVRIESVLMSLPETARWEYRTDLGEEEGTPEAILLALVKSGGKDWLGLESSEGK
jgi:coproporphyrinogen III oxidase